MRWPSTATQAVLVTRGGAAYGEQSGGPPDITVYTFGGSLLGNVTITDLRAAAFLGLGAQVLARRRSN